MKQVFIATVLSIACAAAFAQKSEPTAPVDGAPNSAGKAQALDNKVDQRKANAPTSTTTQSTRVGQDGAPVVPSAAAAQNKVDMRNANNPNPTAQQAMPVGQDGPQADAAFQSRLEARNAKMYMAMDANGDGRVSRAEWNAYHGKSWSGLKQSNGAVSRDEMENMMKRSY